MNQLQKNNEDNNRNVGKGIGRGRGWLKLNEQPTQDTLMTTPGGLQELSIVTGIDNNVDVSRLIDLINELKLERRLSKDTVQKCANELIKQCKSDDDIQNCFAQLHEHALADTKFALKYVTFVILGQENIRDSNLHKHFINNAQSNYENIDNIRKINEEQSRNAILMFACWLINNPNIRNLRPYMLSYLEKLLNYRTDADVKLFAKLLFKCYKQLMDQTQCVNNNNNKKHMTTTTTGSTNNATGGNNVKNNGPPFKLSIVKNVHKLLNQDDNNLSGCSRMWLLIALETYRGERYVDDETLRYYAKEFGEQEISYFQKDYYSNVLDKSFSDIVPKYYLSETSLYRYDSNKEIMYTLDDCCFSSIDCNNGIVNNGTKATMTITTTTASSSTTTSSSSLMKTNVKHKENGGGGGGVSVGIDTHQKLKKQGRPILGTGVGLYNNNNTHNSVQ